MAHWSSTVFDQYAAESDTDGLRNAKPRWQELADLAEIYSSPSSHLSTAAAPKSNQNLGHMDRQRRQYEAEKNNTWSRRLRTRDGNVESPGASRSRSWSRSRSRPTGPRTSMFENPANRRRSKSNQRNFSNYLSLISLLALVMVNLLLSWFGVPVFANAVSIGRSTAEAVQMLYDELPLGAVKNQICRLPMVPSIINCDQLPRAEISRDNTIRHAMPGIVFALSENPDTVDAILDLTEDINKVLIAIQQRQMKTPQPIQTTEPMPIEIIQAKPLCIDHLLNLTSVLEANVLDWDKEKDKLLRSMYITFIRLELDSRDQTIPEFRHAIARELGAIAEVLDEEMKPRLSALIKTWGLLLDDIPIKIQCLDASMDGDDPQDAVTSPRQLSSFKRLLLWILPFTPTPPLSEKRLTPAEIARLLNHKGDTIGYLINGLHASSSKARLSATTAKTLVQRQNSWMGSFMRLLWRRKERFDDDMMGGLREMRGLVPMLMEQRSGQRADRKYMRSMAIAKEESAKVSDESS